MTAAKRRKHSQPILTSLHLPFDLVAEILCRLPAKHLLQLRCACKSCNSLISADSIFAKKHLRLSNSRHDRHHLILTATHSYYSPKFLVLHSPVSSIFSSTFTTTLKQFRYSLGEILNQEAYGNRASTCDGMVCFNICNSSALLCNPSIRKFKMLPPLKLLDPRRALIGYTLVYDRFTNNYKIISLNTTSRKIEVNVHTLGTDYWTRIQDFPGHNLIVRCRLGTFVNDSVNWLTYHSASCSRFIVSLDLEKESYQKLSLSVFDVQYTTSSMTLGTLRGCLSLLFRRRDRFSDVWIMKEYGNEKSWIKLLIVPPMVECDFYGYSRALYISNDEQVLMECSKRGKNSLVVYDSINNTFKVPNFQNNMHGEMVAQEVYAESLISPL